MADYSHDKEGEIINRQNKTSIFIRIKAGDNITNTDFLEFNIF